MTRKLPDEAGVYALCDLNERPIYVGQAEKSRDTSIRKRVQRHLTSARSDIIANRQLDVWEVAYVWAWPEGDPKRRRQLEAVLFYRFDRKQRLVNGTVPLPVGHVSRKIAEPQRVCILPDEIRKARLDPATRFPRQVQQFHYLLDYVLNVQDKAHLRRALRVHHERLTRQLESFLTATHPSEGDED